MLLLFQWIGCGKCCDAPSRQAREACNGKKRYRLDKVAWRLLEYAERGD